MTTIDSNIKLRHSYKYSGKTEEEIAIEKYLKRKQWLNNLSDDKKEYYKSYKQPADKSSGICEICDGKSFGNIYQHRNTLKHKKLEECKKEKN